LTSWRGRGLGLDLVFEIGGQDSDLTDAVPPGGRLQFRLNLAVWKAGRRKRDV
jgi:hypothetical protein